jgi:phosphoglycolate phosphatase-like HAD superfamily hydrolase
MFEALTERGGRIALATECKGPELKHYLSLLNIDEFIAATACGDDVEHGKPDPRIVGMALRKLDLSGFQAVMIGDTPYDAEAASGAGAAAAGVLTGGFSTDALRKPAALLSQMRSSVCSAPSKTGSRLARDHRK